MAWPIVATRSPRVELPAERDIVHERTMRHVSDSRLSSRLVDASQVNVAIRIALAEIDVSIQEPLRSVSVRV